MAVTFDAGAAANNGGSTQTVTTSLTVGSGANQAALAFALTYNTAAAPDPVRIKVDSTTYMTLIPLTDTGNVGGGTYFRTLAYVITGLTSGSHSFALSQGSGNNAYLSLGVASFFGVDQISPVRQPQATFATGTSTSPSVTILGLAGDMAVDQVVDIPDVPGSPLGTQAWNTGGASGSYLSMSGSSATLGWTLGVSTLWTENGVCLRADTNRHTHGGFYRI